MVGLQNVTPVQFFRLQRTCMRKYSASGIPRNLRMTSTSKFNPIFYKKSRTLDKDVKSDTYKSLTWAKLTFQVQQYRRRYRRGVLSENLLAILSGKTRQKKYARGIRPNYYRKQMYFVNVNLDSKDENKKRTLYKLLSHLYFNVMDRRRYRVVLFGTVGWESSARMLENFMRRRRRHIYFSMFKKAMGESTLGKRGLLNQIWQSNTFTSRGFKSVLSAIVHTETRNKPSFSMFLV